MPLARKLYYASLQVGDEVPSWQPPPVDRAQIARFAGASGDFNPLYVDEPFARAAGFRSTIVPGPLAMGALSQMVSDIQVPVDYLVWPGDTLTCRGRVTGKHREGSDYLVDFDLWIENQEGEMMVRGTATASLFHSAQDESQRLAGGPPLMVEDPPAPADAPLDKTAPKPLLKPKPKR